MAESHIMENILISFKIHGAFILYIFYNITTTLTVILDLFLAEERKTNYHNLQHPAPLYTITSLYNYILYNM